MNDNEKESISPITPPEGFTTKVSAKTPVDTEKEIKRKAERVRAQKRQIKYQQWLLERQFPKAYIENGLNATKAYMELKAPKSYKTATVEGSKLIAQPNIKRAIEDLLPKEEETMRILSDVYAAPREKELSYKELHKFWETDLKLRGKLKDKAQNEVNIGIFGSNQ